MYFFSRRPCFNKVYALQVVSLSKLFERDHYQRWLECLRSIRVFEMVQATIQNGQLLTAREAHVPRAGVMLRVLLMLSVTFQAIAAALFRLPGQHRRVGFASRRSLPCSRCLKCPCQGVNAVLDLLKEAFRPTMPVSCRNSTQISLQSKMSQVMEFSSHAQLGRGGRKEQ